MRCYPLPSLLYILLCFSFLARPCVQEGGTPARRVRLIFLLEELGKYISLFSLFTSAYLAI